MLTLDTACEVTRTGDVWVFRGSSPADRAIRLLSNAPVNHVGMTVVLDDLPPLMWHAELGRSLPDMWTGQHQRGVQLHDLRSAVTVWADRYGQQAWLRQLEPTVSRQMEDAVLRTIARLDGTPFPSTARLAGRWLSGRVPFRRRRVPRGSMPSARDEPPPTAETAYCAEVLAQTYQAMGLLPGHIRPHAFDPGSFWSGDGLQLDGGHVLGAEIGITSP